MGGALSVTSTPNLDPDHLIRAVDAMDWRQLEAVADALLVRFGMVAEAPGAQLRETMTARVKSGASAPRTTPVCRCGCPSQRDHWKKEFAAATDRDWLTVWDPIAGAYVGNPEPRATRSAIFRAAEDLDATTRTPPPPAPKLDREDLADLIVTRYEGIAAERAAALESRRQGQPVSVSTLRGVRRRNGYGMALGEPLPTDAQLVDQVLIAHRRGCSDREIARDLDIGRRKVGLILAEHDSQEAAA